VRAVGGRLRIAQTALRKEQLGIQVDGMRWESHQRGVHEVFAAQGIYIWLSALSIVLIN